ncbi:MAG TPA: hypothetical protein VK858_03440, partial [Longimicrobiales bacterium]|nr:hypothetical protein [Longimicrobiales bacterium]
MPSTEESAPPPAIPRIPWIDLLLVVAAAVLVYLNALPNGFTLDDRPIIVDNGTVHDLSNQVRIWLTPYWPGLVGLEAGLYRPLTIFAFAVQWALGGGDPLLFHGVSVLLHAGCSALVYALLRLWVGRFPALAGAGVFAVHPVHVEAVANVVGQAELLAALFVLAAVLLHATRPPEGPVSLGRTGLIVACYGLAMLAKEHAVVLPALLVAVDVARGRARDVGAYLRGTAGTGVVLISAAAVYLTLRWAVLGGLSGEAPAHLGFLQDPGTRIPTALALWPEYLRLLVAPRTLSFTYDPGVLPPATGFGAASAAGLLVLGVVLALVASRRAWPAAGLGAAWFLIGVLPVSNLLLPIGTVLAERTLYLPSVALALWVG